MKKGTVKFQKRGKQIVFCVEHNLPEVHGLSLSDAVENWLVRTNVFTAESLCDYIKSKNTGFHCTPLSN